MSDAPKSKASKPAKVDEITQGSPPVPVLPTVVGQVTVENMTAGDAKADPKVNWNSLSEGDAPAPRPKRTTRDQRQRGRHKAQAERAERRQQAPAKAPQPALVAEETRTITVTLPARVWAHWDKHLERTRQDHSAFLRRALLPQLR